MPFILEKTTKKDGTVRYCQNEECDYKMSVKTTDAVLTEAAGEAAMTETRE